MTLKRILVYPKCPIQEDKRVIMRAVPNSEVDFTQGQSWSRSQSNWKYWLWLNGKKQNIPCSQWWCLLPHSVRFETSEKISTEISYYKQYIQLSFFIQVPATYKRNVTHTRTHALIYTTYKFPVLIYTYLVKPWFQQFLKLNFYLTYNTWIKILESKNTTCSYFDPKHFT